MPDLSSPSTIDPISTIAPTLAYSAFFQGGAVPFFDRPQMTNKMRSDQRIRALIEQACWI
jgi:hypothetical protein